MMVLASGGLAALPRAILPAGKLPVHRCLETVSQKGIGPLAWHQWGQLLFLRPLRFLGAGGRIGIIILDIHSW